MSPETEMYGLQTTTADFFHIDELLDFSNGDLFSANSGDSSDFLHCHHDLPPPEKATTGISASTSEPNPTNLNRSTNFADDLCVPSDDVAELEWLSKFVDDSFSDFPMNDDLSGTTNFPPEASVPGRARSKRFRASSSNNSWSSSPEIDIPATGKSNYHSIKKKESFSALSVIVGDQSPSSSGVVRKCTHCASEKTPQWRTGPMGPKTLCNACGVRYKSGRLVPEYRPAASPTFVLTQHSNSHRKVMELRRQKEVLRDDNNNVNSHHHHKFYQHDFQVC